MKNLIGNFDELIKDVLRSLIVVLQINHSSNSLNICAMWYHRQLLLSPFLITNFAWLNEFIMTNLKT